MEIKSIVGNKLGSLSLRRTTSTNPFEHNNFTGKRFKGNALPFADVFQAIKPVETAKVNKMKMISGAVVSAVSNFKTSITEPIAKFANAVREKWQLGMDSIKSAKNSVMEMGKSIHTRVTEFFTPQKVVADGEIAPKILDMRHINTKASIQDLKATWINENERLSEAVVAA